jgi:hypothetical protein
MLLTERDRQFGYLRELLAALLHAASAHAPRISHGPGKHTRSRAGQSMPFGLLWQVFLTWLPCPARMQFRLTNPVCVPAGSSVRLINLMRVFRYFSARSGRHGPAAATGA